MWYIYTIEYYSAINTNEILPFVTTWMDLEGIMLNEISQKEKDKYYILSHIWNLKYEMSEHNKTETGIENKLVVTSGDREVGRGKRGTGD